MGMCSTVYESQSSQQLKSKHLDLRVEDLLLALLEALDDLTEGFGYVLHHKVDEDLLLSHT